MALSFSSPILSHPSIPPPLLPNPATVLISTSPSYSKHGDGADRVTIASHRDAYTWRTRVSFLSSFLNSKGKGKSRDALKNELLEAIEPLDRGANASPEDRDRVDQIASELEAANQVKQPLKSDLLNGRWELLYTTSQSILGTQRPKFLRPNGSIYQSINTDTLRAQNMETWPFFNQVTANLVPLNTRKVAVKFDTFKILGLIPVKAPGRARGELEITYLDDEIRISRGDKGNLFVLKMVDRSYRVPLT